MPGPLQAAQSASADKRAPKSEEPSRSWAVSATHQRERRGIRAPRGRRPTGPRCAGSGVAGRPLAAASTPARCVRAVPSAPTRPESPARPGPGGVTGTYPQNSALGGGKARGSPWPPSPRGGRATAARCPLLKRQNRGVPRPRTPPINRPGRGSRQAPPPAPPPVKLWSWAARCTSRWPSTVPSQRSSPAYRI